MASEHNPPHHSFPHRSVTQTNQNTTLHNLPYAQAHADKTKDMPTNGLMAFCTFYDDLSHLTPLADDPFDLGVPFKKKVCSALTKLRFRLKDCVAQRAGCMLAKQFDVPLYPNSVFFMPLSTNRLYTHEICPAEFVTADKLPTRLVCASSLSFRIDQQ